MGPQQRWWRRRQRQTLRGQTSTAFTCLLDRPVLCTDLRRSLARPTRPGCNPPCVGKVQGAILLTAPSAVRRDCGVAFHEQHIPPAHQHGCHEVCHATLTCSGAAIRCNIPRLLLLIPRGWNDSAPIVIGVIGKVASHSRHCILHDTLLSMEFEAEPEQNIVTGLPSDGTVSVVHKPGRLVPMRYPRNRSARPKVVFRHIVDSRRREFLIQCEILVHPLFTIGVRLSLAEGPELATLHTKRRLADRRRRDHASVPRPDRGDSLRSSQHLTCEPNASTELDRQRDKWGHHRQTTDTSDSDVLQRVSDSKHTRGGLGSFCPAVRIPKIPVGG